MAIVACKCTQEIRGVALCALAAGKYYYCEKWAWLAYNK